jgi:hypothetical protein
VTQEQKRTAMAVSSRARAVVFIEVSLVVGGRMGSTSPPAH